MTMARTRLNDARAGRHGGISGHDMSQHRERFGAQHDSQRQLRVGEAVRHAFAEVLAHGSARDAALEGHIITVAEVRMAPDLKLATVYVMPLGGRDSGAVIAALERNRKMLRSAVARRVSLKFAPDLRFRLDERFDAAWRIEELLRTPAVARDLEPHPSEKEQDT